MKKARKPQIRFAVCIKNEGYEASLETGKLYRIIPDQEAALEAHGCESLRLVAIPTGLLYLFSSFFVISPRRQRG